MEIGDAEDCGERRRGRGRGRRAGFTFSRVNTNTGNIEIFHRFRNALDMQFLTLNLKTNTR